MVCGMEELKEFCKSCGSKKDIVEIEKVANRETIKLSCGHRIIKLEFSESLGVSEQFMAKHFDSSDKLQSRYRTKTSGGTKRPARDNIIIDRDRKRIIHQVWEQDESGNWELVHDEEKPFPEN